MNNENMKYLDMFKFIFIAEGGFVVAIESEDKIKAIEIFKNEYPKIFESNFKIIRLDREITADRQENIFL